MKELYQAFTWGLLGILFLLGMYLIDQQGVILQQQKTIERLVIEKATVEKNLSACVGFHSTAVPKERRSQRTSPNGIEFVSRWTGELKSTARLSK